MSLNWDDLRFILALSRAGSLVGAARLLKVEVSTVSRRLGSIESALGAQLAARTPEGIVLNDTGKLTAELAETIDGGIQTLLRRVAGDDQRPEGLVRLAATDSIIPLLMRGLIPFRVAYPKIQIELVVSNAALDLLRREADVAVRFFRESNPTLIARKASDIGWSLYAARSYVERTGIRTGTVVEGKDLAGHPVVGYRGSTARTPGAVWLAEHTARELMVFTGDGVGDVVYAVKAGLGISALPCFATHDDPDLVRLTPAIIARGEVFLVIPPDHRNTLRVRKVIDAVAELFATERAIMEGDP